MGDNLANCSLFAIREHTGHFANSEFVVTNRNRVALGELEPARDLVTDSVGSEDVLKLQCEVAEGLVHKNPTKIAFRPDKVASVDLKDLGGIVNLISP